MRTSRKTTAVISSAALFISLVGGILLKTAPTNAIGFSKTYTRYNPFNGVTLHKVEPTSTIFMIPEELTTFPKPVQGVPQ